MTDNNEPFSNENLPDKEKFADEKTESKIHRHLTDEKDEISDDDIKEVRTDIGVPSVPSQGFSEKELKKAEKEEEQKTKDDDDNPIISSWNILDS